MTMFLVGAVLICSFPLSLWQMSSLLLPSFAEARKKPYGYMSIWHRSVYFGKEVQSSQPYQLAKVVYWCGIIVSPLIASFVSCIVFQSSLLTQSLWCVVSLVLGCMVTAAFCAICAVVGRGIIHPLWTEKQGEAYTALPHCPQCAVILVPGGCPNSGCSMYLYREQLRRDSQPRLLGEPFGVPVYHCPNKQGRIGAFYRAKAERLEKERNRQIRRAN